MPNNDWNPALYDQKHAFVFEYGENLISLLDPQPGESILDLGCGTGHLTKTIAGSGAHVVGIDNSPDMVEAARKNYPHINFVVADARDFSFPTPFDALFSNATLHWVTEPERAVNCIAASLKPGGRFVAEFGGKRNVAQITTAIQQSIWELMRIKVDYPLYFPSIGEYATLLEKHNLAVHTALLFERPTKLEEGEKGLGNWITMFAGSMFNNLPAGIKQQVLERTEEKLRAPLFKDGHWFADYRRLRIVAYKE